MIDKIVDQAKAPTVSFTGGEPTLRPDLPELVAYARSRGLRVNLITNGILCAGDGYVAALREAGLHSAQVSLEAADPDVHNRIVGNAGRLGADGSGHTQPEGGGHPHPHQHHHQPPQPGPPGGVSSTCWPDMGQQYLSMNMVIRTGRRAPAAGGAMAKRRSATPPSASWCCG